MTSRKATWIVASQSRAAVVVALLALGGCVAAPPAPAYPPVPPLRVEQVPLPPVSEQPLVWRPGEWEWTGSDYRWREGRYVPRGNHSNTWLYGSWILVGGAYAWVPGHWQ